MKENKTVLVIGGCRSGKSSHALELAEQMAQDKRIFIATCVPYDDEMRQRVEHHKNDRDSSWTALEIPVDVPEAIIENCSKSDVILVDCLTLWISNLFLESDDQEKITAHITKLTQALEAAQCPVVLVSNEVGTGIVPENNLARRFRDAAGFANQRVAACADRVMWMVAGIPVSIK